MTFKETMLDVGKTLVGRGAEVRFKKDVEAYADTHGVSREDAAKVVFRDRMFDVDDEARISGVIDRKSKTYREFDGALHEFFSGEGVRKLKKDAENPAVMRPLPLAPVTAAERDAQLNYYRARFGGRIPRASLAVSRDAAMDTKRIRALLARVSGDPRIGSPGSLESIVAANPELGADFGAVVRSKEGLERHERKFGAELDHEKAAEKFKTEAKEAVTEIFWSAPKDWLQAVVRGVYRHDFDGITKAIGETVRFLGREVWASAKFLHYGAKAAGTYMRKSAM